MGSDDSRSDTNQALLDFSITNAHLHLLALSPKRDWVEVETYQCLELILQLSRSDLHLFLVIKA